MKRLNLRRLADSCAILAEHDLLLLHLNVGLCHVAMLESQLSNIQMQ